MLLLVFPLLIGVTGLALLIGFEEQDLCDALIGIDLGRQRRGIRDLERDKALPLRLEWRDVDDDAAARVGGLSRDRP